MSLCVNMRRRMNYPTRIFLLGLFAVIFMTPLPYSRAEKSCIVKWIPSKTVSTRFAINFFHFHRLVLIFICEHNRNDNDLDSLCNISSVHHKKFPLATKFRYGCLQNFSKIQIVFLRGKKGE